MPGVVGNWAQLELTDALRMQECRDESEIYNNQWIPLSNDEFIYGILGGVLHLE